MRVFASDDSLDNWRKHFAQFPLILCNGVTLTQVIMADDEKGIAEVVCMDGNAPKIDELSGLMCTRFLQGKVEIVGRLIGQRAN